jgi:hypothetical protein
MSRKYALLLSFIISATVCAFFVLNIIEFFAIDTCVDQGGAYIEHKQLCEFGDGTHLPYSLTTIGITSFSVAWVILTTILFVILFKFSHILKNKSDSLA